MNCAVRLVTLGCCYQIHCHPHTESQCSAENYCLVIVVIYVLQEMSSLLASHKSDFTYHVKVVPIPSLDGAIFGRNPLLHSNL